ncbi:hypothetical protein SLEP1_g6809 [Rubroshorea leprosula]|uniref:Uncharacterized protein n=1 Tax=Rubroshorea leprosula TaxID=152421 RepID=A0AAV5I4I6_9ROSI|nr:hypothetical protein SLEP1_g6809 [Rubroshorea leprosula]
MPLHTPYIPCCYTEPALATCALILLYRACASCTLRPNPMPLPSAHYNHTEKTAMPDKIGIIGD